MLDAVATVGTLTYNRGSIAETTLVELGELFGRTPAVRVRHVAPKRQLTPYWTRTSAGRPCRGLTSEVERWVSAVAAIGFSTPNEALGAVPADAFGALEARIVVEHLDGLSFTP